MIFSNLKYRLPFPSLLWIPIILLALICAYIFSYKGLAPIDDHRFIATFVSGIPFPPYIIPQLGRFYPLTGMEYIFFGNLFGFSLQSFQIILGIKIFLAGMLLLYALYITLSPAYVVVLLWGTVVFSNAFANGAFRLQMGETNSLLLYLIFIICIIRLEKYNSRHSIFLKTIAVIAVIAAMFYKEVGFVVPLAFGASEIVRCAVNSKNKKRFNYLIFLMFIGLLYLAFYYWWRGKYATGSYQALHLQNYWTIIRLYLINDPLQMIFFPILMFYRFIVIFIDKHKYLVWDSFLVAGGAYFFCFLALGMYNPWYFLPSYAFISVGICGILATKTNNKLFAVTAISLSCILFMNLPKSVSEMQNLKLIAGNHYEFVTFLSKWLLNHPIENNEGRNLILVGGDALADAEVMMSLKIFIESLNPDSKINFKVRTTELITGVTDQDAIRIYGVNPAAIKFSFDDGDILIYNPYQQSFKAPPKATSSLIELFSSKKSWSLSYMNGLEWVKVCLINSCDSDTKFNRYVGYSTFLLTKKSLEKD